MKLGGVPYGWRYSSDVDANGRRLIVKHPEEQKAIKRICALHDKQVPAPQIVQRLEQEGLPPRGKRWHTKSVYQVLTRAGHAVRQYRQDAPRVQPTVLELKRDKQAAAQRAVQLRAQRLSLRDIGARLLGEGLLPPRGAQWYAATVLDLLPRPATPRPTAGCPGHESPRGCASSRRCADLSPSPQSPEVNKLQRSEPRRCAPSA